jgi:hypothetical protein
VSSSASKHPFYVLLQQSLQEVEVVLEKSTMEDIFSWCKEGNAFQVRVWLDDTENDLNQG